MNPETIRTEALKIALSVNAMSGINCPGCLVETAQQIATFISTGETAQVQHFAPPETDGPSGDVVPFKPRDLN